MLPEEPALRGGEAGMQEIPGPPGTSQSSRAAAQQFCSLGGHPGVQGDNVGDARPWAVPSLLLAVPSPLLALYLGHFTPHMELLQ